MRLTRAKLFIKERPFGRRDYFVLQFRQLFAQSPEILFLLYDGQSSSGLSELRALAPHYGVKVHLLLRRWASSVFTFESYSRMPFGCRLVVLHSSHPQALARMAQDNAFASLLQGLPFYALSHRGLLSQEPFFPLLAEPKGERLLVLLLLLQYKLLPIVALVRKPLLYLLALLLPGATSSA